MPEYDYRCEGCRHSFTVSLGIKEHDTAKIKCPKCKSAKARQKIGSLGVTTKKKS
jgi:putative FmdB family regulatory protein